MVLDMCMIMEQTLDGLNNLNNNFDWDNSLFRRNFEVVGVAMQELSNQKLMRGVSQSVSPGAYDLTEQGIKLPDHDLCDELVTLASF